MKKFLVFSLFLILLLCPVFVLASDKVEINTASLEQLDEIIGIGPALGQKIIDTRPFSSVDDLIRVKGIGEKTLQKIKEQGLAYVENQVMQLILQTPSETPPEAPSVALAEPLDALPTETPPQDVVALIVYPSGIVFNEILPSPKGPDAEEEWIEIFNQNNFEVDLTDWKIQDTEGKTTTYTIPNNTKIKTKSYLVLTRPVTKITLNNTGDKLILLQPDGKIVDTVMYEKSPQSQSYNKIGTGWSWSSILTPGSTNTVIDNTTIKEKQKDAEKIKENVIKNERITASLNQIIDRPKSFLFIFLIAMGIAVFSSIAFFFLKKRICKK